MRRSPASSASSLPTERRPGVPVEAVAGAARRAGLAAGDRILVVNGRPPLDVLDLEMAAADGELHLVVDRRGRRRPLVVRPGHGEGHGISLEGGLGDTVRRCVNGCSFCFVDQMPPGLRPSLYVKDDDYRLSFLQGTFITLSNLSAADIERIIALRLSPLYVSLHAWDDAVRAALMGPATARTRVILLRLLRAGVRVHVQVVLCPSRNDGAVLEETITALAGVGGVEDVGVVPVSLAREDRLRRVGRAEAAAALGLVERLQPEARKRLGRDFAHAADELYLLAGRRPPASDAEEQYENGIGLVAAFLFEAARVRAVNGRRPVLLSGELAAAVVADACARIGTARPLIVRNRLFGDHVTVTGLLGGREVLAALAREPLAADEWLLAPAAFLPVKAGRTLDDVPEAALRTTCGGRFVVGTSLTAAFATLAR